MRKSLQGLETSDPEAKLGVCPEEGEEKERRESAPERERRKETPVTTDAAATEHASGQTEFTEKSIFYSHMSPCSDI